MKTIGFHYHIPFKVTKDGIATASFLGVFIDAVAARCGKLIVFGYDPVSVTEDQQCNYVLRQTNIQYISLGKHVNVPLRLLRGISSLLKIRKYGNTIDVFILRSPTPLNVFFYMINKRIRLVLFVIGDFKEGIIWEECISYRQKMVYWINHWIDRSLTSLSRRHLTIVNSRKLYNKYEHIAPALSEVKTTTLSRNDFLLREDWKVDGSSINVLYTGRMVAEKCLDNILEACIRLYDEGIQVHFHLAGNLIAGHEHYVQQLKERGAASGFTHVYYHGLKKVGEELNEIYRAAHIYVIASRNEGFPRTIWEAMANSVPVVASKVGSIPFYLRHGVDALLIAPGDVEEIRKAIMQIVNNASLRKSLIANGFALAKENTLEVQTDKLLNAIMAHGKEQER